MLPTKFRYALPWFIFFLIIISGCAIQPLPKLGEEVEYYRSDDYIVYRLQAKDTPTSLARVFYSDPDRAWLIKEANPEVRFKPGRYVVIPLKPKNYGGISSYGLQQIPILCYHRFGNHCQSPLCVPAEIFDRQMKYLKDNGYRVITPKELLAFLQYRRLLPKKSVMITVDDGYESFYTVAYPILKKYGFSATLFIYTNYVGVSSKALSWNQLRELKAAGFYIGSHTIMHSDLTKQEENESEQAYLARLRHEIFDSKKIIDRQLHQDTFFFAYPFGRANEIAMKLCEEAGYDLAVTVHRGGNVFFANPHLLRRDQILKRDMATFISRLKTFQSISLR